MKNKRGFFHSSKVGFVICFAICGTLTGCVGFEAPNTAIYENPNAFAAQDDYVYYPQYECYYSVSRHQYAYRDGNVWVARSAPPGVAEEALRASPSVKMNFHDSPAGHHAMVVKQYPKTWKPSDSNQAQNRKDDQRGSDNGK